MKKVLGIIVALTAASPRWPPSPSRTRPAQGPTFRTGVDVVAVDVSVVDGNGQPVEDLLAPDFVVKIDGEPRRVVSADHVRIDVEAAKREAADPFESLFTTNLKPPNGRMFVIAVDQLGIRFGGARGLLDTAGKFLDTLSPADRTAFVAYPEPGISVGFTNDRLRLKQAMQRVVGRQQSYIGQIQHRTVRGHRDRGKRRRTDLRPGHPARVPSPDRRRPRAVRARRAEREQLAGAERPAGHDGIAARPL